MERTDTMGSELKPTGRYILTIERVLKSSIGKEGGPQYPGYKWFFHIDHFDGETDITDFNIFMFKSQMAEILRAVDAKEVSPEVFEWEMNDVKGKRIECQLVHVEIKDKKREQLIEIKKVEKQAESGEVAWDE